MAYELHIERLPVDDEGEATPIPLEDWKAALSATEGVRLCPPGADAITNPKTGEVISIPRRDGDANSSVIHGQGCPRSGFFTAPGVTWQECRVWSWDRDPTASRRFSHNVFRARPGSDGEKGSRYPTQNGVYTPDSLGCIQIAGADINWSQSEPSPRANCVIAGAVTLLRWDGELASVLESRR
jgi:hypothetical protein